MKVLSIVVQVKNLVGLGIKYPRNHFPRIKHLAPGDA